ncbi:hypothetical protein BT63DRAFT_443469 [Microthyrium microscopicum]|uniref:Chromosome condensation protein n=1 Tax=Microthyrium microscopicum TaxID=703497 RepID=A0A6A6TZT5_9PEZI|nr:hypothetical protein BT63DRAFT_443469 [Microthyrium microscopicum]
MTALEEAMSNPTSSSPALSTVDLGEHIHRISLPSLAASLLVPSLPQHPVRHSTTNSRNQSRNSGRQPSNPDSYSSLSSTERDRERERERRLQQQKRTSNKNRHSTQPQFQLPPPRRSSQKKSRFVGFDGIYNPNASMSNLEEVSADLPVTRHRNSGASEGIFMHGTSTDNIAELSAPSPLPRDRDLAHQARRSQLDSAQDYGFDQSQYLTPSSEKYHDDRHDYDLDAAPPPSVSPMRRSRIEGPINLPAGRSLSRLDQIEPAGAHFNDHATQLYIIAYLIFFSILGTLARLGLKWLTFYPGNPVNTPILWANFAGCLIIGFLIEDRNLFTQGWGTNNGRSTPASTREKAYEEHVKVKKTIPLYIGLAVGFCGSFTSFSSFMEDSFLALSNNLPTPQSHPYPMGFEVPKPATTIHRSAGYAVCAVLAVMITTITLSVAGIKIGSHIAIGLDPYVPTIPFRLTRKYVDRLFVPLAWLAWLGALLLAILPPDRPGGPSGKDSWTAETWRPTILACLFAPLGCLLRYYLSVRLNSISAALPLGTFAANIFGTAVLGMAYDLSRVPMGMGSSGGIGGGLVGCQVLQGIMDGFCGSLTTVSTWALEMVSLHHRGYLYGGATVTSAFALIVVIMGSVRWSIGFSAALC